MSQRKLCNKFNKRHMTIGRQIKKLCIEDYAREKTPKYTEMNENVYFVDETTNPPNVPQARPIENLWGILAQKV